MGSLARSLLVALAVSLTSATAAVAAIRPSDAAATHAYLRARIAVQHAAARTEPAAITALAKLEGQLKAGCPGVLTGAPPHVKGERTNESDLHVSEELLIVTLGTAERVEHAELARFARTVRRLRWSNPKLTRLLRSLALESDEQSAIPVPDLCSDLRFWVSSGYTAVSAGTQLYLHRLRVVSSITTIEPEPNEPIGENLFKLNALVAHRLRPYEDRADRLLARKALPPEPTLSHAIDEPAFRALLQAVGKVYAALGSTSAQSTSGQAPALELVRFPKSAGAAAGTLAVKRPADAPGPA
jgi:hypothetical protein